MAAELFSGIGEMAPRDDKGLDRWQSSDNVKDFRGKQQDSQQ
jgi:hypothetical protein